MKLQKGDKLSNAKLLSLKINEKVWQLAPSYNSL
jgi:hypothetical protein